MFDPLGGASLNPRGLIGMIYVENHWIREHTKYISCGSHGFKEKDFLSFSYYKSMENFDPKGGASLDHRGLIGRIYVDNH